MKHFFKGGLALVAWLAFALGSAQITATSYAGAFTVDNQPYNGGPILWFSLAKIAAGGMNPATSMVWLAPEPNTAANTDGRTMMKFKADGTGDLSAATWKLPSASDGSESTATFGETRIFSTWTSGWCSAPINSHEFHSEVSVEEDAGQAWVEIDVQEAPKPFFVSSSGVFEHDYFDNGGFDQDPMMGSIVLDKFATPTVSLSFDLPSFSMHRSAVQWQDGTRSPSSFNDVAFSSLWVIFDGVDGQYAFLSPLSDPVKFNAGEDDIDKTISAFSDEFEIDISGIAAGEYSVHYRAVSWTADFVDASGAFGCRSGYVAFEHLENTVQVVPEASTMLALSFATLPFLFKRQKRRHRAPPTES
jgi:hypothetical protein